jgi:hypothetical protein
LGVRYLANLNLHLLVELLYFLVLAPLTSKLVKLLFKLLPLVVHFVLLGRNFLLFTFEAMFQLLESSVFNFVLLVLLFDSVEHIIYAGDLLP